MILFPRGSKDGATRPSGMSFPQSEMSPVLVVIADVFFQQSSQVPLIQNNHMVEQLSAHTPNPALSDAVLPWTSKRGSDRFRAVLFDGRDHVCGELRIVVKDQKPVRLVV